METISLIAWVLCAGFVVVSLFRPLTPFQTRLQALGLGLPALTVGIFVIAAATGAQKPGIPVTEVAASRTVATEAKAKEPVVKAQPASTQSTVVVVSLTHINQGTGKRVTYTRPVTKRIERSDVASDIWTIASSFTDVLCFEDGNNAVIFTIDGDLYAANGKARQFVRFKDGDGVMLDDGILRQVHELKPGSHPRLVNQVIKVGLALCGQKSLDEISDAVKVASETEKPKSDEPPKVVAMTHIALAMRGAEVCGYEIDFAAIAAYARENGVSREELITSLGPYVDLANEVIGEGGKALCEERLYPKYGPKGFGFLSK